MKLRTDWKLGFILLLLMAVAVACRFPPDWPSFSLPQMPTLEPLFESTLPSLPALLTQSAVATATPRPGATAGPTASPTPEPLRNGRLLYLGLDQQVWSVQADGSGAVSLGRVADFHAYASAAWYDRLGRYALVARREEAGEAIYLSPVAEPQAAIRLGPLLRDFDFAGPRDIFGFAADGKRFFFIDASTNPASLIVIDLESRQQFIHLIQASAEEISFVAFLQDSRRMLVKAFDPNLRAHYLEVYEVGAALTNPRRLPTLDGHRIEQFAPSPDGRFVALVYRSYDESATLDRLFVYDFQTGGLSGVVDQPGIRILLTAPAWSPDGRYLLANTWTMPQPGNFAVLSHDAVQKKSALLLDGLPSQQPGEPLARAATFAPDKLGVGLYVYQARPGGVDYWTALLDGSYKRQVTQAQVQNNQPEGEYVSAVSSDWTRLLLVSPDAGTPTGTLYVTALDGSRRERLDGPVPYRFFELGPVISPDQQYVAYLRLNLANQQAELCTIDLNGGNLRVLFQGAQPDLSSGQPPAGLPLVWLPAGR